MKNKTFIVRQYDKFDREWIDISGFLPRSDALTLWNKKTDNGTKHTQYEDGYYFAIFPFHTRMLFSLNTDE